MSGGDWVAVDPERLDQAASKLEALRDTLAANIPVIKSMMNAYGSDGLTVPGLTQALSQALARTPQDAADMRARSRLAWYLNHTEPPGVPEPGRTSWMIEIPWDRKQVDQQVAPLEAQALIAAVNNTDPAAGRAQLAAVAQDLGDQTRARTLRGTGGAAWMTPGTC